MTEANPGVDPERRHPLFDNLTPEEYELLRRTPVNRKVAALLLQIDREELASLEGSLGVDPTDSGELSTAGYLVISAFRRDPNRER